MLHDRRHPALKGTLLAATLLTCVASVARADDGAADNAGAAPVPSGQLITPGAIPGSIFTTMTVTIPSLSNPVRGPDGAIQSALNPADKSTLVVMTSGYNTYDQASGAAAPASYNGVVGPEYIFVFDVSNPAKPVRNINPMGQTGAAPAAALTPQDTFQGLIWSPDGAKLYVSGGTDGNVLVYSYNLATKTFAGPTKIQLIAGGGDADAIGIGGDFGYLGPQTSGLALDPTGRILVALNMQNDSLSVVDTSTNALVVPSYDLRPYNTTPATGDGQPGGEEPYGVAVTPDGKRAYVTSIRDREVDVIDISKALSGTVSLIARIPVAGSPNNVALKASTGELFVAEDNSDQVAVIDTVPGTANYNKVVHTIDAIAPPGTFSASAPRFTGAATNNVALSPDGATLYVTNGGANDVAVVPLTGPTAYQTAGLVPTGWYPTTVTPSADGAALYVFNAKSDPGGNPLHQSTSVNSEVYTKYPLPHSASALEYGGDQYVFELEQSGFLAAPLAGVTANLATLTAQVEHNNGWSTVSTQPDPTMTFLRSKIKHVIYIVKENRTFDQVLGDLANGANADPSLATFNRLITPNFHRIATNFVTLDNFFDPGEVSGNGWPWSTAARETDWNVKNIPMDYTFGYGSFSHPVVTRSNAPYDAEGQNANVSVGYSVYNANGSYNPAATVTLRTTEGAGYTYSDTTTYTNSGNPLPGGAINVRPGAAEPGAPDGAYAFSGMPEHSPYQSGYLWNAALNAGLTIRNYGFFSDNGHYGLSAGSPGYVANLEDPEAAGCVQTLGGSPAGAQQEWTAARDLIAYTDPCFHGFDNAYPDAWRFEEFQREFEGFVDHDNLPNLVFLRYMHDHMGNFGTGGSGAVAGVNFPEAQQADNDYAVGATLEMLANSPYASDTLVFVVEDDAQDGPDHMDAHRSTAYVVGPYVKQHAVVSTRYSTVNMVRTIEDVLGLQHVNLNTAHQAPMSDVFNTAQSPAWTYTATVSTVLRSTTLDLASAFPDGKVQYADATEYKPLRSPDWWAEQTRHFDFTSEDRVPTELFNQVIWEGIKGDAPYPAERNGKQMRGGRLAGREGRVQRDPLSSATSGPDDGRRAVPLRAARLPEPLPPSLPPVRAEAGRLPRSSRGADRLALLRGALAACLLQTGVLAGAGLRRVPTAPPDPVVELVVEAPAQPQQPPAAEPQAAEQPLAQQPPASAPAEPAQEPAPETVAQPAPPPPQPDAAAPPPAAAAALPSLPPPVRAPAIRTRSELRRILTPPPAQQASDAQTAPARAAPAPATAGPGPQAAEPRAAASAPAAEATFEGRVRDAIQAALRVPQAARLMGLSGRARVRLGYRDGSLTSASLDLSAGSPLLDDAALRAAREAAYPSPPAELQHRLLTYLVWVRIDVR